MSFKTALITERDMSKDYCWILKEALAWRADNTSPTPYVSAMAGGVEEVRVMLLNSILAKVDAVAQAEMYVLQMRDFIEACDNKEAIDNAVFPS